MLYEKALKIQPQNTNYLNNYGFALIGLAKLEIDEDLFTEAFKQYQNALKILSNQTYNLACYYSIKNNQELCKENLLNAEKHNTLPSNPHKHLSEDQDLNNIRQEQWFNDLLERLKEKEGIAETA